MGDSILKRKKKKEKWFNLTVYTVGGQNLRRKTIKSMMVTLFMKVINSKVNRVKGSHDIDCVQKHHDHTGKNYMDHQT